MDIKLLIKRIILGIFILITCWNIFYLSSESGDESDETAGGFVDFICSIMPQFKGYSEEELNKVKNEVVIPVIRKCAHLEEFTALGFFTMWFLSTYKRRHYQMGLCTCLLGLLYAISDEIHQGFSPGRSPKVEDVWIDFLGVLIGTLLILLCIKIREKHKGAPKMEVNKKMKVLFISSKGGHFSELMQLKPVMEKVNYKIVTESTKKSNKNLREKFGKRISIIPYGTKKTPIRYIFILLANCFASLWIYIKFRPHVIVTTGTHTAGPMCCIGRILGSKVIFIESFANRNTKSEAGKLVYYVAHTFVVQWDEMEEIYPKAKNWGWIY